VRGRGLAVAEVDQRDSPAFAGKSGVVVNQHILARKVAVYKHELPALQRIRALRNGVPHTLRVGPPPLVVYRGFYDIAGQEAAEPACGHAEAVRDLPQFHGEFHFFPVRQMRQHKPGLAAARKLCYHVVKAVFVLQYTVCDDFRRARPA
jgi:hypothetical protein